MVAGRALGERLGAGVHEPALAADPGDLLVLLEDLALVDVLLEGAVPLLVVRLDLGDVAEALGDLGEALAVGDVGERRVQVGPLLVLAVGGGLEVLGRGAVQARPPGRSR